MNRIAYGLICLMGGMFLAACNLPAATPTAQPSMTPPPTATAPLPTWTAVPTELPTATPAAMPALNAPPLTAANIASAQMQEVPLGFYTSDVMTPGNGQILVYDREAVNLRAVTLDPPGIGPAIPLDSPTSRGYAFAPDGSRGLFQAEDGSLIEWNRLNGQTRPVPFAFAYGFGYSSDGRVIVISSRDEWKLTLLDTGTLETIKVLTGFETAAPVYGGYVGPGGKTAVWVARATARFQDVQSGVLAEPLYYTDFIGGLVFAPNGGSAAVWVAGLVQVVGIPDGAQPPPVLHELTLPADTFATGLAYSPDGSLLAITTNNGVVVMDVQPWTQAASFPAPGGMSLRSPVFTPDGRALAATGDNNSLVFWRIP